MRRLPLLLAGILWFAALGFAQGDQEGLVSVEGVEAALERLDLTADGALEEQNVLNAALERLRQARELRGKAEEQRAFARAVPGRVRELEQSLAADRSGEQAALQSELANDWILAEWDSRLKQAKADLRLLREEETRRKAERKVRSDRLLVLPGDIARTKQELSAAEEELRSLAAEDLGGAQGLLTASRVRYLNALLEYGEAEQTHLRALTELGPLIGDRFQREQTRLETRVSALQERVTQGKTAEAESDARAAMERAKAIQADQPRLQELAQYNEMLAGLRTGGSSTELPGLPQRIEEAERQLDDTKGVHREVIRRYNSIKRHVQIAGVTDSLGLRLRRDFVWLPSAAQLEKRAKRDRVQYTEVELEKFEIQEQRNADGDPRLAAQSLLRKLGKDDDDFESPIARVCLDLFEQRRNLQDEVITDLTALSGIFAEQHQVQSATVTAAQAYRAFMQRRILWIRSANSVVAGGLNRLPSMTVQWVGCWLRPTAWSEFLGNLKDKSVPTTLVMLLLLALVAGRKFLIGMREQMNRAAANRFSDRFLLTIRALLQSALIAAPLPLLMWQVGWLFSLSELDPSNGLGHAMRELAFTLWALLFWSGIAKAGGVAEVHFRWNPATTALLRKLLAWFTPTIVLLGLLYRGLHAQDVEERDATLDVLGQSHTLGRLAFCVAMGALAWCLWELGRKSSPLWENAHRKRQGFWLRMRTAWAGAAAALPLGLILFALLGYYYTSLQLELRVRWSLGLTAGLVLVHALLLRWLSVVRWRLAIAQAREKAQQKAAAQAAEREAARAAAASGEEVPDSGIETTALPAFDESDVDLPALDSQTRQLFGSGIALASILGFYLIWASALPALQGLDRVHLWPKLQVVEAQGAWNSTEAHDFGNFSNEDLPGESSKPNSDGSSGSLEPNLNPVALLSSGASVSASGNASNLGEEPDSGFPSVLTLGDIIWATVILLLTIAGTRNLPSLLEILLLRRLPLDSGSRYAISTLVRYLILIIGISAGSSALGLSWDRVQWLVAALTFGLAFGLQEIFANFVSGLIILLERPVRVGDVVTVGTTEGIVTRLRMRATTIQDFERREMLVPNKEFITTSVTNWTLTDPITRMIVKVGIAYGSDVDQARKILLSVAKDNAYALESPTPAVVFRRFGDSTLDFELRVFIANRDKWPNLVDTVNTAIDKRFAEAGIEIAFPQRDLHLRTGFESLGHQVESKGSVPQVEQ